MAQDGKVSSGDPLAIPAATWNALMDALADYKRRATGGTSGAVTVPGTKQTGMIRVRNTSDVDWSDSPSWGWNRPCGSRPTMTWRSRTRW